ncbi:pleckstrin homology-like domain family B member 1 [Musca domestica]|uniref:Pleckstrin homology-like domain family B member 1 n=1 Tax=Musca domestica TaxID=7370 RepID=A0A1I8NEG2_MUSDO|nr:pleckstrin homology-like domain family B member 1 [Musca domestica]
MSLSSKKDPSLRVAANEPHLVSLGGGRLSTAVTIHNIPVGDTTIGSSLHSNISLSGAGVRPLHCIIYRSEENQVTLVPERGARILIDGQSIDAEVDLKQGAMITMGDSYALRYNNPIEAEQMRTAIGNRLEDFEKDETAMLDYFYETNINPNRRRKSQENEGFDKTYNNLKPLDINGWQCPKVFSSDLVTVNMPAKDVLGQKYANFAKNLAENHRKDKNVNVKHNEVLFTNNIPGSGGSNAMKSFNEGMEFLSKVQNTNVKSNEKEEEEGRQAFDNSDYLEDMLKICTEYAERQDRSAGGSLSSSPIVQNRIKTNGSLPREKKSPFQKSANEVTVSPTAKSSGYENVRLVLADKFGESETKTGTGSTAGYENVRYVPQSPRTKIRTNCLSSPKKEISAPFAQDFSKTTNYEDLIKNFEEKFQKEIEAIEESSRNVNKPLSANNTPLGTRRSNKNINNLTIDIKSLVSPHNSPKLLKKPTPAPRNSIKPNTTSSKTPATRGSLSSLKNKNYEQERLHIEREDLLRRLNNLKQEISILQQQDNEALIEMDMENALVLGELQALNDSKRELEQDYKALQQRIHRLEAQRNATRVMEENQQAKLKQAIEMKQDQVEKLKEMLKQKPDNPCLKEELANVCESLENDRKAFEDLEFQYLEGESDWQAQCEELHLEETTCLKKIEETKMAIENIEKQEPTSSESQKQLRKRLVCLLNDLQDCEQKFKDLEEKLATQIATQKATTGGSSQSIMSQSLFGSTEILCPKAVHNEDLMSKSFNENMFYNNKIEIPQNALRLLSGSSNNSSRKVSQDSICGRDEVDEGATTVKTSKEASNKIMESIKEIERNRKLLASKQEQKALEKERHKIEEILKKLNSDTSTEQQQKYLNTLGGGGGGGQNKENLKQKRISVSSIERQVSEPLAIQSPGQKSQMAYEKQNSAPGNYQRPLSESNSETADDLTPGPKRKSFLESPSSLRTTSPESPRSCSLEKRCSSVLSSSEGSERRKMLLAKHQRPLTRYMPIFAQDLDLRRHIISAGHQIDLCPHIFVDELSCRGYLHKLGSTFHTWSKRWFVFDRQRNAFIYYSDKSERKPRGGAYFSSIDEVYMDHLNASKSSRPHCTFIVKTKKRKYYLQAASDAAARIWIDVIITGAQGNIDY